MDRRRRAARAFVAHAARPLATHCLVNAQYCVYWHAQQQQRGTPFREFARCLGIQAHSVGRPGGHCGSGRRWWHTGALHFLRLLGSLNDKGIFGSSREWIQTPAAAKRICARN